MMNGHLSFFQAGRCSRDPGDDKELNIRKNPIRKKFFGFPQIGVRVDGPEFQTDLIHCSTDLITSWTSSFVMEG